MKGTSEGDGFEIRPRMHLLVWGTDFKSVPFFRPSFRRMPESSLILCRLRLPLETRLEIHLAQNQPTQIIFLSRAADIASKRLCTWSL